MQILIKNMILV